MSDTDLDPNYLARSRTAQGNLALAPDTSADDAARSIELEDMTGAPASYIARDVKDFEDRHKLSLSRNIISGNPYLTEYVNQHPLFSSVSQNDWHNLDGVTDAYHKVTDGLERPWWKLYPSLLARGAAESGADVVGSLGRIVGSENLTAKAQQLKESIQRNIPLSPDEQAGLMAQIVTGAGALIPMAAGGVAAAAVAPEALAVALPFGLGELGAGVMAAAGVGGLEHAEQVAEEAEKAHGNVMGAYTGGLLSGTALNLLPLGIVTRPWEQAAPGLINWGAAAFKRALATGTAQSAVGEIGAAVDAEVARSAYDPNAKYSPDSSRMVANMLMGMTMGVSFDAIKAYIDSGSHIPPGLNPLLDQLRFEATRVTNQDLDELIKRVGATDTPQHGVGGLLALDGFLKLHPEASVGLDKEQVMKLYGGKPPELDDNLFGWIPNIAQQMSASTGDVRVPLADWVRHTIDNPDLAKEMKDHIRVGLNGLSLDDIKGMAQASADQQAQQQTLLETPEIPRYVGGLTDSGAPVLDSVRKSLGMDKILPVPPEFWTTRGRGIIGRADLGITNAGATVNFLHNLGEKRTRGEMVPLKTLGQTTGAQILKGLDLNKMPGISRQVLTFFRDREAESGGNIPIYLLKGSDIKNKLRDGVMDAPAGFNDSDSRAGYIVLNADALQHYSDEYLAHVVIHEMSHAVTVREMFEDAALTAKAQHMMDETKSWVLANQPELMKSHDIGYAFSRDDATEFIAQAHSAPDFIEVLTRVAASDRLRKELGLPHTGGTVWEGIKNFVREALEKAFGKMPDTIMDGVLRWSEMVHDSRVKVPQPPKVAGEPPKPPGPPGEPPVEPGIPLPELFEDYKVLGYTKAHWERVKKLLTAQLDKDAEWKEQQARADAERRVKDWWKDEETQLSPDARQAVYQRPVIAAERFLRLGALGQDVLTRRKLDGNLLTQDQRDTLNPEYWSMKRGNLDPEAIAPLFGYRSGQAMISDLIGHSADMKRENMAPTTYINSLVKSQLDQMMKEKHGSMEENILEEAKDHVIDTRGFDLMHEDMLRIATKAGLQAPMSKEQVRSAAEDELKTTERGHESADKLIDEAGRRGREIEALSTAGDWKGAFAKAQQRQILFYKAMEMRDYEKLEAKGLAVAKRHVARELDAFKDADAAPFHDFIQMFLNKYGMRANRDLEELLPLMAKRNFSSFRDFVEKHEDEFHDTLPIPDFIKDTDFTQQQKLKTLTIGQSQALWETLMSLDKRGRWVKKVNYQGEQIALDVLRDNALDELESFAKVDLPSTPGAWSNMLHKLRVFDASSRIIERLFNRMDRGDPRGVMNQIMVRGATEAANHENSLDREYGTRFRALGTPKDFTKIIDPPPMVRHQDGRPLTSFTNMNKIAIALNMGNDNNWWKFTDGRNMSEEDAFKLWNWEMRNMTPEEWKWVQGVWDIFKDIKKNRLDPVYLRTTGFPPRDIAARQFTLPDGTVMDGGYYPLMADHQDIGKGSRTAIDKVDKGSDFFQMNIPNPHARERTGALYPLTMSMDHLPDRFYQMIHDIAFKEYLMNAKKFMKDSAIRNSITQHFGEEYLNAIDSWMVRMAGAKTFNSAAAVEGNRVSEFLRQNTMSFYVGFNIGTVLKHGPTALVNSARQIGTDNLLRGYKMMYQTNPETGESWKQFIDENSEEIQRRSRDWAERFGGVYKAFTQGTLRERVVEWGSKPVAFSDMLSAYPTWLGAYFRARDAGADFGEARFEADRAVRYAHGSTAPTNLPEIATGGGIQAWITSLYHFFGTMLQNRMEIAFKLNDMYNLGRHAELKRAAAILPALVADVFAYVVWPTAVEEYVTGLGREDRRGWGQRLFWASAGGLANSVIYARDIVHALEYGVNQEGGLADSAMFPLMKAWKDTVGQWEKGKTVYNAKYAGNLIQDIINLTTYKFGTPREVGNLAKYGWDVSTGVETPRTGLMKDWYQWGDVGRGLTHGSQKMSVVRQ